MNQLWRKTSITAVLLAACAGPAVAADPAAPAARSGGAELVTLNFVNADIEGVVKAVGEITGRNFILDPRVKGTVNIISAKPMSRALIYDVFLSALRLQGFAAVEDRGIVKILPEADAKQHRGSAAEPQQAARDTGERIETRIFGLEHESAVQLVTILRPLITANNTISAAPNSNSLVITDYAGNLQRIERIIYALDQPKGADPIAIPLRHASALDVAQTITRMFAESGTQQAAAALDPTLRVVVVADARSNSLLASAGDPARLSRIRQLVTMLDTPTSAGGNIHVVYMKNAEAVKVAETLRAIYSGDTRGAAQRSAPATPGTPAGTSTPATQPAAIGGGIVQADAATNAIIITAPDVVYNNLRAALEKLDVRRAQVYVEAVIAEITAEKAAEFGIQWQDMSGAGKTTGQLVGGTNFGTTGQNLLGVAQNPLTAGHGLNIGIIKGVVNIGGTQILNLGALLRALQSGNNANILSTPTLLTLDNEEAKIVIGQNVPFITGQYAVSGAATTPTPFQTIERKDVGLTLRIKPQISEAGVVRLTIFQEVSSIQDRTNVAGVITNKRSIESTVLAQDGQMIVIGGLLQDSITDGEEKVPGLGDLPGIGGLFRYNTRARSKTNLMVFLRPTVLRTASGADPLTSERYDYIRGEQIRATPSSSAVLPDYSVPVIAPRPGAGTAESPGAVQPGNPPQ